MSTLTPENGVAGAAMIADPGRLLDEWLEVLESLGREPRTLESYRRVLTDLARRTGTQDFRGVSSETVERYLRGLFLEGRAPRTRRKNQIVLRGFFGWLAHRGGIAADPTKAIPPVRVRSTTRIPVFSLAEIARLTFRCPRAREPVRGKREPLKFFARRLEMHHLVECRDTALLALAYNCALRGGEPALLERDDYDESKGELTIRAAKWSDEPSVLPIGEPARTLISVYLVELRHSRWAGSSALFPPIGSRRSDSKRQASGVGLAAVDKILRKRIARAGIHPRGRNFTPHCLRRSRGTHLSEAGVPIEHVQVILRHASILTTRSYIALAPANRIKRRADARLALPRFDAPSGTAW